MILPMVVVPVPVMVLDPHAHKHALRRLLFPLLHEIIYNESNATHILTYLLLLYSLSLPNPVYPPYHRLPLSSLSAARPLLPCRRRLPTLVFHLRSHRLMRWRLLRQTIALLWIPSIHPVSITSWAPSHATPATTIATNP